MESPLPKPPPPVVGKVTHHSIELYWEDAYAEVISLLTKADGPLRVTVQEQDQQRLWGNVYTGSGKRCVVDGLEEKKEYCFRMRFQVKENASEWSPHCIVSTTREPLNGQNLHRAIISGRMDELEQILESGEVSVDVRDSLGFTPLMQAAKYENILAIDMLMKYGADIDYQNESGKTALMIVCAAGKLESVKALRKYNASYNIFDNGGCSAVHWAVDSQNIKLIEWMGHDGADLNLQDKSQGNWTPLIRCACLHGNRDFALALMMAGADINATDSRGSTPLHHAVIRKNYELTKLLLQRKANPLLENKENNTPYQVALSTDDRSQIVALMDPYVEVLKKRTSTAL